MNREQLLLTGLAEEASEVAQRATKAIRFGLREEEREQLLDNAGRLGEELADLLALVEMTEEEVGFRIMPDGFQLNALKKQKRNKVEIFLDLSAQQGILKE